MAVGFKHRRNPHSRKGGSAVEKHLTPSLRYLIPESSLIYIYMLTPVRSVVAEESLYKGRNKYHGNLEFTMWDTRRSSTSSSPLYKSLGTSAL